MEIDVTRYARLTDWELADYSASRAEFGDQAGRLTWRNAMREAESCPLVPLDDREGIAALVDWLAGFGAWTRAELCCGGRIELNALLLQFVAGDLRGWKRAQQDCDLAEWQEREGGRVWNDARTGRTWFYVGI